MHIIYCILFVRMSKNEKWLIIFILLFDIVVILSNVCNTRFFTIYIMFTKKAKSWKI